MAAERGSGPGVRCCSGADARDAAHVGPLARPRCVAPPWRHYGAALSRLASIGVDNSRRAASVPASLAGAQRPPGRTQRDAGPPHHTVFLAGAGLASTLNSASVGKRGGAGRWISTRTATATTVPTEGRGCALRAERHEALRDAFGSEHPSAPPLFFFSRLSSLSCCGHRPRWAARPGGRHACAAYGGLWRPRCSPASALTGGAARLDASAPQCAAVR